MELAIGALLCALLLKFFWTLVVYRVPLGYDLGLYRYLFIRHADGFPPFIMAPMDEWAKGHPLGLFFFTTVLMKLGLSVGWLLGWMWNLMAVILAATLATVIGRRDGRSIGVLVLLASVLSIAYFDGFAAMYWKTFASLFWCVITYHLLEKKSYWAALTGMLTVATHHQTGLLFGLAFVSWILLRFWNHIRSGKKVIQHEAILPLLIGMCVLVIGILWYVPVWQGAVLDHLPTLLKGIDGPGGNFPPALFYLRTEGILLALGAVGFGLSIKRERWTLWQLSALWSFIFVAGHLLFYRRFFLQLDFFLLPFAALAMQTFWTRSVRANNGMMLLADRIILLSAVAIQAVIMSMVIATRVPIVTAEDVIAVEAFKDDLSADAFVLGLENESVTLLRGWMPYVHVGGPGLFESRWSYEQWETFILGTHDDRALLLKDIPGQAYVFVSAYFVSYYGDSARKFLQDSCFSQTAYPQLYKVVCP
jgi:hypothetical protein